MEKGQVMKYKDCLKELSKGAALAVLVTGIVAGTVKINAAGTDTSLPELYQVHCKEIGRKYDICPELLEAVIEEESSGDPDAVGAAGEIGLMQVYPKYHLDRAERLGVSNLFSPKGNILVGADYLAELFREYEDMGTVLMIYNGTADAVELGEKGEYTEYAKSIIKRTEQLERLHKK